MANCECHNQMVAQIRISLSKSTLSSRSQAAPCCALLRKIREMGLVYPKLNSIKKTMWGPQTLCLLVYSPI